MIGAFLPLTELMTAVDQDVHAVNAHNAHQNQTDRTELEGKQRTELKQFETQYCICFKCLLEQ